jgi:hypothetical protein
MFQCTLKFGRNLEKSLNEKDCTSLHEIPASCNLTGLLLEKLPFAYHRSRQLNRDSFTRVENQITTANNVTFDVYFTNSVTQSSK